jgi:hypothetical protein
MPHSGIILDLKKLARTQPKPENLIGDKNERTGSKRVE